MPRVSVYIPCHNAELFVADCIEGVLGQKYPVDEIIVIDDGSRDRTLTVAEQYPVSTVRHQDNKGLAAARNTAFQSARNELVAALDADCIADADWLDRLVPFFNEDRIAAAGGQLVETRLDSVADRWRKVHMTQSWGCERLHNPPFMFGNNTLIRKSVVEEAGGYDERLRTNGEDADLSRRILAMGYQTIFEPAAVVRHLRRDSVRSVLDTYWRYWRFGAKAYFHGVSLKTVLYNVCRTHFGNYLPKVVKEDWRGGNLGLLWLDLLLPFYLSYRDLGLYVGTMAGRTPGPD